MKSLAASWRRNEKRKVRQTRVVCSHIFSCDWYLSEVMPNDWATPVCKQANTFCRWHQPIHRTTLLLLHTHTHTCMHIHTHKTCKYMHAHTHTTHTHNNTHAHTHYCNMTPYQSQFVATYHELSHLERFARDTNRPGPGVVTLPLRGTPTGNVATFQAQ